MWGLLATWRCISAFTDQHPRFWGRSCLSIIPAIPGGIDETGTGVAHDNPDTIEPERFRFDICGEVTAAIPDNPQGVVNKIIPGGCCAVVRHFGAHDRIGEGAYYLYRDWLPNSGEELRDFPLFFHYLNLLPETPEHELVTDIYLPLT